MGKKVKLLESQLDRSKILDFLLVLYFLVSVIFYESVSNWYSGNQEQEFSTGRFQGCNKGLKTGGAR